MSDMNKFAKDNDLARKFEAAIQIIDNGKGWEVFKDLDKGTTSVKVTYDGEIRFHQDKKPKKKKKKPSNITADNIFTGFTGTESLSGVDIGADNTYPLEDDEPEDNEY